MAQNVVRLSVILCFIAAIGQAGYAMTLTVKLKVVPEKFEVTAGSGTLALIAETSGTNLQFTWEVIGPGRLEGADAAVLYHIPERIEGPSTQASINLIVRDQAGQGARTTLALTIWPNPTPDIALPRTFPEETPQTQWLRPRFEVWLMGQYMGGDTSKGRQRTITIDNIGGAGVGLGYRFKSIPALNLNTIILFYGGTEVRTDGMSDDCGVFEMLSLSLDYAILYGRVTPLITGGIGSLSFYSDYGMIEEQHLSYHAGAGFRWDFSDRLFVKGIYRAAWTTFSDAEQAIMLDGISISAGYNLGYNEYK